MCVCAKSLLQSCPTLCNPMDCSLPGSCVSGIPHARTLEWVAMPASRQDPKQTRLNDVHTLIAETGYRKAKEAFTGNPFTVQKHQFFGAQLSLWSKSHFHT